MLKIAWNKSYRHPLPEGHRFPMEKYDLIPEQLMYEGTINPSNIFDPGPADEEDILRVHDSDYLEKLKKGDLSVQEIRRIGFPLSTGLISREICITRGTIQCALYALESGISFNVAGGTHHAYRDRGEGFCLLNDIAVAASFLAEKGLASKILIVDLDVHQGNGTAKIFEGYDQVITFSMHGENNYPLYKERSFRDIALPDGTTDNFYLEKLDHHLNELVDICEPDFLFYQAGVDVLASDKLGRLGLTGEGCAERDRMVLNVCKKNRIPAVVVMGGGYSDNIGSIIEAHANTFRQASEIYF
ncbi:MAG: histone deacetylase [Cyclobacteriaceae bacterium]|nr:histone deacetylase [Cyclobacteriaceae bacterium]